MTKGLKIGLVVVLIFALSAIYFWFYSRQNKTTNQNANQPPITQQNPTNPPPQQPSSQSFSPLSFAPIPSFIKNLKSAEDIRVDFHYEGDYTSPSAWQTPEFYTPEGSTEKFLSLSKVKDRKNKYAYGPESFSIFTSQESHSYQGTPIYLLNQNSKYTVSYIGFKVSERELIRELKVEFGIDYLAYRLGSTQEKTSVFASIFGIQTAHACGPGTYLRHVGDSNLVFVEEVGGVAWYRLEKPVAFYNLSLNYCDDPSAPKPSYCNNEADDPSECWEYCHYNASISNLASGNLRMHMLYKPNDKEGLLRIQMVNLILNDPAGMYYQATMGKDFDHYYRAYLH